MFQQFISFFTRGNVALALSILYHTSFVWLPILLLIILWELWITYRREQFFAKTETVLLEIKLPREIFKSPLAMEIFMECLSQGGGEGDWYEKYWKGQTRAWFSLELVSIDGGIHFFIWTRKGLKNLIEANLYAQFPGIEIYEVSDYTLPVIFNPDENSMWVSEFDLTKSDAFPIKTYIDYGLDRDQKEEYKIDPITPLIEFLGSLGVGQQAWVQIIVRSHKAEFTDPETGKPLDKKWAEAAKKEKQSILDKTKGEKDKEGKSSPGRPPTKGEAEIIAALERSVSKPGFDVGIRSVYIAPKDIFNPSNIGGIIGGITHFNSSMNGFKPARAPAGKYKNFFLLWKDRNKDKINREKKKLLTAYKKRAYFYNQFKKPYFVLNTEELATLYHFPGGMVSTTPTFSRIGSKKSEAPSNLPI